MKSDLHIFFTKTRRYRRRTLPAVNRESAAIANDKNKKTYINVASVLKLALQIQKANLKAEVKPTRMVVLWRSLPTGGQ